MGARMAMRYSFSRTLFQGGGGRNVGGVSSEGGGKGRGGDWKLNWVFEGRGVKGFGVLGIGAHAV